MSFDIFVQDLPLGVAAIDEIADDFVPGSLGPRARIVEAIRRLVPEVTFDADGWADIERPDYALEINLGVSDPVKSFAFHLRGDAGDTALFVVAAILEELGLRALAPGTASGFFELEADAREAYARWREWSRQRSKTYP